MNNSIVTLQYNDQIAVNFTNNAWFNATEVAKNFGKKTNDWLRLESTKEYIACLEELAMRENPASVENQLVRTEKGGANGGGGSWFHPKLAVSFARWLDVRFAVWCDMQIDKLLKTVPNALRDLPRKNITGMEAAQLKKSIEAACKTNKKLYSELYRKLYTAYGIDSYMNLPAGKLNEALLYLGLKPAEMPKTMMITVDEYEALKNGSTNKQLALNDLPTMTIAMPNDNNRLIVIRNNGITSLFEIPEDYLLGNPQMLARDLKAQGYILLHRDELIARLAA